MNQHPLDPSPPGALIGGLTAEQRIPIIDRELLTARRLERGEPLRVGDIYGGQDWGFVFEVHSPGGPCPGGCYRWRRPNGL